MRTNRLRDLWSKGGGAVNGWLGIPSSATAEFMANAGWDSLTIDMQHGLVDYQTMVGMLQAVQSTDTCATVRVPWNEQGIIGKVLDAGAQGIICPMVNTPEEAEALVRSARYPPMGERSFGPLRAAMINGPNYPAQANQDVIVWPMIETRVAVANVDAILSVDGIDGCYIGPADLGLTHGFVPKGDRDEPELLEIIARIRESAKSHGKTVGIHCQAPAYGRRMIEDGFDLVTIAADMAILMNAAKAAVSETRDGIESKTSAGLY
ncbi:MAG: aldolase/citrate lyase family protein [Pseudomonadota bacterium]